MEKNKKKILLVEDDLFILGMYSGKLKEEGFDLKTAEDGASALKMAKENIPDLILLDIIIPVMNGFEVLAEIKKDKNLENVPVVMLTNLGQKKDIERGLKMGAQDYIIKAHFAPSEVMDKIRKILGD